MAKNKKIYESLYAGSVTSLALPKTQFGRSPARTLSRENNSKKSMLTSHPAYHQKQAYLHGTTTDQSLNLSPTKDSSYNYDTTISPPKRSHD
jgi:hypothetical protein